MELLGARRDTNSKFGEPAQLEHVVQTTSIINMLPAG